MGLLGLLNASVINNSNEKLKIYEKTETRERAKHPPSYENLPNSKNYPRDSKKLMEILQRKYIWMTIRKSKQFWFILTSTNGRFYSFILCRYDWYRDRKLLFLDRNFYTPIKFLCSCLITPALREREGTVSVMRVR